GRRVVQVVKLNRVVGREGTVQGLRDARPPKIQLFRTTDGIHAPAARKKRLRLERHVCGPDAGGCLRVVTEGRLRTHEDQVRYPVWGLEDAPEACGVGDRRASLHYIADKSEAFRTEFQRVFPNCQIP